MKRSVEHFVVGTLEFEKAGKTVTAQIHSDGKWTCEDRIILTYLNACHQVRAYWPSHGSYGALQLYEAAERLGKKMNAKATYHAEDGDVVTFPSQESVPAI